MIEPRDSHVFFRDSTHPYPVVDRAEGCWIWDTEGNRYLDATGGAVVVGIGHGIDDVIDAMYEQARRVAFAYGMQFTSEVQEKLAAELADLAPGDLDRVFLVSGGSEATETAIKMARQYHLERGDITRHALIARWRGYHGNTMGALSASGQPIRRAPYLPYLAATTHIEPPYRYRCQLCRNEPACTLDCADAIEAAILELGPEHVSAFISETVGGSSVPGMVPVDGYFQRVREICDRYGVLYIADEVMCGVGRTGYNFAVDHWGVVPDIIVTAKGLSSGYAPLGAVIARRHVYDAIAQGSGHFEHGFTYGGHPVACAAGLAAVRHLRTEGLVQRAGVAGRRLLDRLREELADIPEVGAVEGLGLLIGIELVADPETRQAFSRSLGLSRQIVAEAFSRGVIILPGSGGMANGSDGDRLEIAPPLVIDEDQIKIGVEVVSASIRTVLSRIQAGSAHAEVRATQGVQ